MNKQLKEKTCAECIHYPNVCRYYDAMYLHLDRTRHEILDLISDNRTIIARVFMNNLAKYCKYYNNREKTCSCNNPSKPIDTSNL